MKKIQLLMLLAIMSLTLTSCGTLIVFTFGDICAVVAIILCIGWLAWYKLKLAWKRL